MISQRAIQNFLKGALPREESEAIARYLRENPDALTPFLNEDDWLSYLTKYQNNNTLNHDLRENDKLIAFWAEEKQKRKRRNVFRLAVSVAASIVIILGIFVLLLHQEQRPINQNHDFFVNTGTDSLLFSLKDGTQVNLAPNSNLKYEITEENERLATLDGGAHFVVQRDSLRKFIVKAQEIYSTVLGTSFSVQANKSDRIIRVGLHTGKLAVQYISDNFSKDKYILQPGDVYYYSKETQQEEVIRHQPSELIDSKENPSHPTTETRNPENQWYMFNNQPLGEVFDQLSGIYGVDIYYHTEDLKELTFIGKIDKTDTLEQILEYLSRLNGLELSKKNNQYIIKNKIPN
ncbi:FecR family protein [Sphingobacterium chuzhouense]|uniref:DUF4974 domain-containing protein n=1 Tax=Sphingobacterium chuzhouense TaxID=1742264 RepID=A0ABR7XN50_9SPHI|nr:FecR family protein [Sphingobacterium chuzhouense]MBD1420594.1 DUF4974 domain-containing protein [Sphingobacterium chuzhouense]